jgi:hypothetical protein
MGKVEVDIRMGLLELSVNFLNRAIAFKGNAGDSSIDIHAPVLKSEAFGYVTANETVAGRNRSRENQRRDGEEEKKVDCYGELHNGSFARICAFLKCGIIVFVGAIFVSFAEERLVVEDGRCKKNSQV